MSLDVFARARTAGFGIEPLDRLALLALADAADPNGRVRDASPERIANWASIKLTDARAALDSLEHLGFIVDDAEFAPGEYQLTVVPGWELWFPSSGEETVGTPYWMDRRRLQRAHVRDGRGVLRPLTAAFHTLISSGQRTN